ncbi:MAG: DUF1566 domain-containing protein, partial [Pseudomonadota bacterium]
TAVQPSISISTSEIFFGGVNIGKTLSDVVTVTNIGPNNLVLGDIIRPVEPFMIITDNCSGRTLASSTSCSITIQFSPTEIGAYYDTLYFPSSDETYPDVAIILKGDGVISYLLPDTGHGETSRNPLNYAVNNDNTAIDGNTNLMWQRNGSPATMTWTDAGDYCRNLELEGYSDWRLPSFLELTTIVNYGASNPAIDSTVFPGTRSDSYWTAFEGTGNINSNPVLYAGAVNFAYGEAHPLEKAGVAYVRCVRGQEITSALRPSGELNSVYPYTHGQISTDQSTGLVWTGDPISFGFDPYICDYVSNFGNCVSLSATNACSFLLYAGQQDWRVPTIKELATLSNRPCFFENCYTISSTPSGRPDASGNLTNAYLYSPGSDILSAPPSFNHAVTCVRGGNRFNLKNIEDTGSVAVMEMAGNLDANNPDGSINYYPRQEIAKEYIRTHGDSFDFLVFVSTFDYALPESGAEGFYLPVRNDVQGINQQRFDISAQFGSNSKLQGTVDLGNISAMAAAPYGPLLDTSVRLLNHELMHRFGSYVRFKNPDGTINTGLLGKDSAHWSYLLDSKGSIMYGNGWKDNTDGTFTSVSSRSGFNPLDLYLMGMIPKEQVPPMLLIDNSAIDKTLMPSLGASITGTAKTITIDDIIAAEGERIPNAATAQKKFNVGFVLLTRAGDSTTTATQAIETLRSAWAGRLAEQTNGVGGINGIAPSVSVVIDSPAEGATIVGPDVTVSGTVINTSGAETGVTVNGMPATVTGNRFIVNHVPLTLGSNTISITATDANRLTTTANRNVTATTGNYIRISSNIESGTGPLDVNLRIDASFVVAAPVVHVTGPGGAATLTPVSDTEYTAKFISEGTYTVTATATGPDGQSYTDTVTVTVMLRYQLETLLKGKWEGMKAKVATGDIQGAGAYFPEATRDRYQAIFNDPYMEIMSRLNEISAIKIYTIMDDSAQGGAIRQEDDGIYAYPINFVRDDNGIWSIYGF